MSEVPLYSLCMSLVPRRAATGDLFARERESTGYEPVDFRVKFRLESLAGLPGTSQDKLQFRTRYSSQFKNIYFTEMCSGSEEGSFPRFIDFCITQL